MLVTASKDLRDGDIQSEWAPSRKKRGNGTTANKEELATYCTRGNGIVIKRNFILVASCSPLHSPRLPSTNPLRCHVPRVFGSDTKTKL